MNIAIIGLIRQKKLHLRLNLVDKSEHYSII